MKAGKFLRATVMALAICLGASMASAQAVSSGPQAISLNAKLAESLTLTLDSNSVNFTLAAGSATNAGAPNVTATTKWTLNPGRTKVGVYAYFTSSTAALTGTASGVNIPPTAFSITDTGAGSGGAGNSGALGNAVTFGTGLQLANVSIVSGTNTTASRTDQMAFNIDLSSAAMQQIPADTYSGTLNIQAQATP
jgi:hypothetical protein